MVDFVFEESSSRPMWLKFTRFIRFLSNLILTNNIVDDAVDVVPGEHLPGEGKLYSEKSFRLKLDAFTPKLHLMFKV